MQSFIHIVVQGQAFVAVIPSSCLRKDEVGLLVSLSSYTERSQIPYCNNCNNRQRTKKGYIKCRNQE